MAAPAFTTRVTPGAGSFKMPDGFRSLIAFQSDPSIWIWEHSEGGPKPFGVSAGGPIPTTTMHNIRYRTQRAKKLLTLKAIECKVAYDPDAINNILALIGFEQAITQSWPENSKWAVWGFLDDFEPSSLDEGKMPTATIKIEITNWDVVNQVEAGPAFQLATGT